MAGKEGNKDPSSLLMEQFGPVIQMDMQYCDVASEGIFTWMDWQAVHLPGVDRTLERQLLRKHVLQTGSTIERAGVCRWFRDKTPNPEVDIMFWVGTIPKDKERDILEPLEACTGFYRMKGGQPFKDCLYPYILELDKRELTPMANFSLRDRFPDFLDGEYIDTMKVKQLMAHLAVLGDPQNATTVEGPSACAVIDMASHLSHIGQMGGLPFDLGAFVGKNLDMPKIYVDSVICLKLSFWPDIAKSWMSTCRRKYWPSKQVFDEIVESGCHVVPKSPPSGGDGRHEWRLSFSVAEKLLAKTRSEVQYACYLISKSIFYVHIKPIEVDERYLSSYVLKTIMLWMMEETKPEEWKAGNLSLQVAAVFGRLEKALENQRLQSFFVEAIDLFGDLPRLLLLKGRQKAMEIQDNVTKFIPENINDIMSKGTVCVNILSMACNILKSDTPSLEAAGVGVEAAGISASLQPEDDLDLD